VGGTLRHTLREFLIMATTTNYPMLNEDECGCQTQGCVDCAQDAVARSEADAIDNMCQPAKHIDARYENLTLTIRDLEAAIARRDAELVEKRAAVIYQSNEKLDTLVRANSLQMSIYDLEDRILGYERDMAGTVKELEIARDSNARHEAHIAELQGSLVRMTTMASEAATEADKHLNIGAELSDLLNDSGKREDRMHETLMGIRALAESNSLTDNEKVALILRLA